MKVAYLMDPKFVQFIEKLSKERLPVKCALNLSKTLEALNLARAEYENIRNELLIKYGDKNNDGDMLLNEDGTVKFTEQNLLAFSEEMQREIDKEIDIFKLLEKDMPDDIRFNQEEISYLRLLM
jgi:hypothetical protein